MRFLHGRDRFGQIYTAVLQAGKFLLYNSILYKSIQIHIEQ